MSIAPMLRVSLCGPLADKADAVEALQDLGCVHLIPLREAPPLAPRDAEARRRARAAYGHLVGAPEPSRPWPARREIDVDRLIADALANRARLREAHDRADFLQGRIAGLAIFGDFDLPPEPALRGMKLWFYVLPIKHKAHLDRVELPWQIIGRDNTHLHLAVLSRDEPPADLLPVARVRTGARRLSELRQDLEETKIEIEQAETERAELSRSRLALGARLARAEDADDRRHAQSMTLDEGRVFALQGWAPADRGADLLALGESRGLAVALDPPGPDDVPPTLLANEGPLDGVGALTSFYMTPDYRGWDPSLIVFGSFAIFFAMILADAGYAAVLAGLLGTQWSRLGASPGGRRARTMLSLLLAAAFVYGALAGSYFGVAPSPGSLPASIVVIDVADADTMMRASIIIGVLHLTIANAAAALAARTLGQRVTKLGWIAATVGGLLIWLAPGAVGGVLLVAGLAAVFAGGALGRPIRGLRDGLLGLLDGAMALTSVTKIFGDVLSYMRL
ncbi:MAG: V-type ATP synthase subunit I, partial [Pseudomonadota bacterium]